MKKIAILAYDGCWAMGVFSVTDFFRVVTLLERHLGHEPGYQVDVLSAGGREVQSASGPTIWPDSKIAGSVGYDLIVIPAIEGVRLSQGFTPEASIIGWLKAQQAKGALLLALTTGACFLAATGLMDGNVLATHWAFVRQLKKRYPECEFVPNQPCLHSEGIWSTGTFNGTFDALLEILAQYKGDHFSQMCAAHLLVSTPEQIRPILPGHRSHRDEAVLKAQNWIEAHHAEAPTIEMMSQEAGMSERTFKRRFLQATKISPNLYVQKVRVDKAKKLLLATESSIKAIAYEVGYENVSFFVRVFKKHTGQTPARWREAP